VIGFHGFTPVNDHQDDGVIRVWLALVLLCRAAASFNKQFKQICNTRHFRFESALVITAQCSS
ncbi:hypothetical protein AB6E09_13395, partial [Vibrio lentus]